MEQLAAYTSYVLGSALAYELSLLVALVLVLNIRRSLRAALARLART